MALKHRWKFLGIFSTGLQFTYGAVSRAQVASLLTHVGSNGAREVFLKRPKIREGFGSVSRRLLFDKIYLVYLNRGNVP